MGRRRRRGRRTPAISRKGYRTATAESQARPVNTDTDGQHQYAVREADVFNADTDLTLFDENLLELGLKWKFLSAKGLPYAEEFRTYEQQLAIIMAGDQPRYTLNMGHRRARPAANVPETGLGT